MSLLIRNMVLRDQNVALKVANEGSFLLLILFLAMPNDRTFFNYMTFTKKEMHVCLTFDKISALSFSTDGT